MYAIRTISFKNLKIVNKVSAIGSFHCSQNCTAYIILALLLNYMEIIARLCNLYSYGNYQYKILFVWFISVIRISLLNNFDWNQNVMNSRYSIALYWITILCALFPLLIVKRLFTFLHVVLMCNVTLHSIDCSTFQMFKIGTLNIKIVK